MGEIKYMRLCSSALLVSILIGCHQLNAVGEVILYWEGQAQTSYVHKVGPNCIVSWFDGVDHVVLKSDGSAVDVNLVYRWVLDTPGIDNPMADHLWFAKNCADPP